MTLTRGRVVGVAEVPVALGTVSPSAPCVVLLVGLDEATDCAPAQWFSLRKDLIVARVNVVDHAVQIAMRDADLEMHSLLNALRELADRGERGFQGRVAHFRMHAVPGQPTEDGYAGSPPERPLLRAAMEWIHAVLHNTLNVPPGGNNDLPGFTLTPATLRSVMEARAAQGKPSVSTEVASADAVLARALEAVDARVEPLATAYTPSACRPWSFTFYCWLFRRSWTSATSDAWACSSTTSSHRVGTLGLCASLIGEPSEIRRQLSHAGNLARWRVFDGRAGALPAADEPLRVDPALCGWLLGELAALDHDPRVRRLIRLGAWPGADLFPSERDRIRATGLLTKLQSRGDVQWLVFGGVDVSAWRALLELGAELCHTLPIRVDAARLAGLDVMEIEESGVRLGRLARLTMRPVVVDASGQDPPRRKTTDCAC